MPPPVFGQYPAKRTRTPDKLPVDYAVFSSDSTHLLRLELYYQISNNVLQFQKVSNLLQAHYEISVTAKNKKGKLFASFSKEGKITAKNEQQATAHTIYRTKQVNFELEPGKYTIDFTLRDKNAKSVVNRQLKVKLEPYGGKLPRLSDIELAQYATQKQEGAEDFTKGNLTIVPSVTRSYGGDSNGNLLYYQEIYRGSKNMDKIRVETILRNKSGKMVYRDSATAQLTAPVTRQLRQISLKSFMPGKYDLEVVLKGRRNKEIDQKKTSFSIRWTAEAMLQYDYKAAVEQLSYIADKDDIKELKKITSHEERLKAFNDFWRKHDPTPGTAENELKREFYRRISIANEQFSVMGKEGWRTDRGRIFIQYGEPDRIDDFPLSDFGRPYQQWHYYSHGPYRKFTFVDEFNDGDYRLVYPYDGLNQRPGY